MFRVSVMLLTTDDNRETATRARKCDVIMGVALAAGHKQAVLGILHSVNNRPAKRLPLLPMLSAAFYIVPHAGWNYGIVMTYL